VKLVDDQGRWRLDGPIVSTPKLVKKLETSQDNIACVVDHFLNDITGGFVTEFTVGSSISDSEVENHFFKVTRGKYLK